MKKILLTTTCALIALSSAAWAEHDGAPHEGKKPGKRWEAVDTNGDGFIDKSEFLARGEEAFKKSDTNGDGKLSEEERKAAHEARKEKREERRENREEMKEKREEMKQGGEQPQAQ